MPDNPPVNPQGALVDQIAARLTETHAQNVQTTHASLSGLIDGILEAHESDLSRVTAPILAMHVEQLDLPEPVREMFAVLLDPKHQTQFFTALFAVKGIIDQFVSAAIAPAVQDVSNAVWPLAPHVPLTPTELALAVIKGKRDAKTATDDAALSGIDPNHFGTLVDITGEPISLQEALLLYRRGQITQDRLRTAVEESRVRNEWFPEILDLRFAPPPAGEVIAGALKEHLDDATARDKLGEAGINPSNFDWMKATAGRPYGTQEALHLLNRGVIDEARVREVIAQSDINTHFADDILELRWYIPPVRSILPMLRAGAIDNAAATRLLQENGVRAEDIPHYLAEAQTTSRTTVKELTQAQVLRMYVARFITRAEAQTKLEALDYDAATVDLLLGFADESRHEAYVNAIVSRVHSRYVGYKLSAAEVHTALSADGVPPAAITDLLRLWDIEREANYHVLTPSAIVGAYRRQEIDAAETKARLLAIGVQLADLHIVVADAFAPTRPNPAAVAAVVNA